MNRNRVIQILFACCYQRVSVDNLRISRRTAHFYGNCKTLQYLITSHPDDMNSDNTLLFPHDNELVNCWLLVGFRNL